MSEVIAGVLDGLLAGQMVGTWQRWRKRRAFRAGRPVAFQGAVLGEADYCFTGLGYLVAAPGSLEFELNRWERHPTVIPLAQLTPGTVRAAVPGPGEPLSSWWQVLDCQDGDHHIRLACDSGDLPYLLNAFGYDPHE